MQTSDPRIAVVTGGNKGIGFAIARGLAQAGDQVLIGCRDGARGEAAAASLRAEGLVVDALPLDVTDDASIAAAAKLVETRFGRLDVLVNNAGTTHFIPHANLDALTEEVWNEILGVNLKGTFYCCRAAAPELRKQRGAIVNVASVGGHRAVGSSIPYGVSKAGILQLTRALALALAPDVRVNSVSPGQVSTRWFRQRFGDEATVALETSIAEGTPMKAIATADQVAQAVMALVENDIVTGQDLVVDGGRMAAYG